MPPKFSKELNTRIVSGYMPRRQPRTSPCEASCPAGNRIQAMETLLKDGRRAEAHAMLLSRNPFPGVTGRVCPHPCESRCNRNNYDQGVSIRALERFAADDPGASGFRPGNPTGKRVAVIGSGPAGMSCAWFLGLFEAAPVLGGVPRVSVPDFRLPKNVPDREAGNILALGISVHTNTRVGRDITLRDLLSNFDACVVAVGNSRERRLNIPGMEMARQAVAFLTETNLDRRDLGGKKVVILGGGGVAFDCAFTARRLGAVSVSLIFPEDAEHIKAPAEEVEQARAEGVTLYPSRLTRAVTERGVEAVALASFFFDEKGELQAQTLENDVLKEEADLVICASGLVPDLDFLDGLVPNRTPRGMLAADERMATSVPGLFAAGDIVDGPSSVASAVGSGRRAALGVHAALMGLEGELVVEFSERNEGEVLRVSCRPPETGEPHVVEFEEIQNPGYHSKAPRRATRAGQNRLLPFAELDSGFDEDAARAEAERCMHCGHCINCGTCVERCPGYIIEKDEADGPFIRYPDECWHCACCRIGCPTASINIEFPITMLV